MTNFIIRVRTFLTLVLYYGVVIHLPATNGRYIKWPRKIRQSLAKVLFDHAGSPITIEKGANFGTGRGISIGDHSGIGMNAYVRGPLKIGDNVLMGPDCVILTTNHNFDSRELPIRRQGATTKAVTIGNDV